MLFGYGLSNCGAVLDGLGCSLELYQMLLGVQEVRIETNFKVKRVLFGVFMF